MGWQWEFSVFHPLELLNQKRVSYNQDISYNRMIFGLGVTLVALSGLPVARQPSEMGRCCVSRALKKGRWEWSRQFSQLQELKPLLQNTDIFITEAAGFVSIRLIILALILQMCSGVRIAEALVQMVPVVLAVSFIARRKQLSFSLEQCISISHHSFWFKSGRKSK